MGLWLDELRLHAFGGETLVQRDTVQHARAERIEPQHVAGATPAQLRAAGAAVDEKVHEESYGKFGWVMDPEGNRIELWEPPAEG